MANKNRSHPIQNIKQIVGIICPKCNNEIHIDPDELCEKCHQEYIESEIVNAEYQIGNR